ncbi:MAG: transcriptional regulator [Alphaproteobacteria bacterium]|nr:MAG: transcriptional regulator [Alphaproteobacteria bacterium]
MSRLGKRLIRAAEEAAAMARGEAVPGAVLHMPPDVRAIRARLGLSQPAFAARFGLPVGTVRDWEQGRAVPDQAARVLLRVIEREPEAVARALRAAA